MILTQKFLSFFVIFSFFWSSLCFAQNSSRNIAEEYANLQKEIQRITENLPSQVKMYFDSKQKSRKQQVSKKHLKYKKEYLRLKNELHDLKPYYDLQNQLNEIYLRAYPKAATKDLYQETNQLSLQIIPEIHRLKKTYKSSPLPIINNMMINAGMKKRGVCKHWAEDLLEFLKPIKRNFFHVTWGTANPNKSTEHNVAVLFPIGKSFDQGLIIDPWRTAGRPFWVKITEDKHYKWEPWSEYGIY